MGFDFYHFITGNETSPESFLLHNALARKPKRIRTAFSPSQLLRLEHAFEKNHYVVGAERKQLAHSLSLTETQVRRCLPVFISVYSLRGCARGAVDIIRPIKTEIRLVLETATCWLNLKCNRQCMCHKNAILNDLINN